MISDLKKERICQDNKIQEIKEAKNIIEKLKNEKAIIKK